MLVSLATIRARIVFRFRELNQFKKKNDHNAIIALIAHQNPFQKTLYLVTAPSHSLA